MKPKAGTFVCSSVMHFCSGPTMQNHSGVDTGELQGYRPRARNALPRDHEVETLRLRRLRLQAASTRRSTGAGIGRLEWGDYRAKSGSRCSLSRTLFEDERTRPWQRRTGEDDPDAAMPVVRKSELSASTAISCDWCCHPRVVATLCKFEDSYQRFKDVVCGNSAGAIRRYLFFYQGFRHLPPLQIMGSDFQFDKGV